MNTTLNTLSIDTMSPENSNYTTFELFFKDHPVGCFSSVHGEERLIYLERRGCDFFNGDNIREVSDVGNYRVGIYNYMLKGKDGRQYSVEFGGHDRYIYRTVNKRTGAPLKHPVKELAMKNQLYIRTYYEKIEYSRHGYRFISCYGNVALDSEVFNMNLQFTRAGILQAINHISAEQYNSIAIVKNVDPYDVKNN